MLESVRNQSIDIMFAMRTSEREKIYLFGTPFLEISVRIFVREDVFGISGLPDLENRTVAVVRGFACQDALIESGLDFRIVAVETVAQALDLLANGDVFAFVGQYHLAKYALQQKARQVKTIGDPLQTTPFGIAMHREQQNGISRLDRALEELKKTGEYAKIHEKWYGTSSGPDTQTVLRYSLPILIGLLAIFGILVTWSLTLRHQVRVRTSALYENLEKFRKLTDRAPFPVAIIHDNSIEYINPQFTMTFGYTLDDIPDCEAWFSTVFPDPAYRATVIADWQQHVTEKIQINDTPRTYDVTTRDGRIVTVDFRMIHLDDGRIIIILEDVTLKHRMEEERLRQQQIESISLLAGGIAHDFNNILMHLIGHINLLQISEGMAEEQMESLSSMERSIQRARGITGQLLTFSRGGAPVKKLQSLAPIIRESIDFVFHGSNCTAEVAVPDNLPALDIDSGQISQTLNNILINAIQAMP
ncbi:MAG TPA: transporter substrate-binding domain-containing protein, partial [Spirochaetota bacterium]|nr:transporter substrate-binding domain-containing protein [Spirochaetota bacterium]